MRDPGCSSKSHSVLFSMLAARTCRASTAAWMAAPAQESATCVDANILGMLSSKASTCDHYIRVIVAHSQEGW